MGPGGVPIIVWASAQRLDHVARRQPVLGLHPREKGPERPALDPLPDQMVLVEDDLSEHRERVRVESVVCVSVSLSVW